MTFSSFLPHPLLQKLVACYWIVEGVDSDKQKIIPDGFTELIFHFGDPYKIQQGAGLDLQPSSIAAGQLLRPIFLQPTGTSGVLGIKLTPTGWWSLFGTDMHLLTNQTLPLTDVLPAIWDSVQEQLNQARENSLRIGIVESILLARQSELRNSHETNVLVDDIIQSSGQVPMHNLRSKYKISARKMERVFLQQVGIPAKLYSRLVRFTGVFRLLQQPALSKSEATYLAGYFDQAHFNKEFREFTGENPEAYFQQDHALSNFFLNR